jgi:hypothetical protein
MDEGFDGGTLVCAGDCTWDTSGCDLCGDGVVSGAEVCDGNDVGGTVCTDLAAPQNGNFTGGTLTCLANCSGYDEDACTWCGDGSLNGSEICEGNQLGGATCVDAGWLPGGGGNVTCTGACALDGSMCTGTMCGGSLAVPPDGAGVCPMGWTDSGSACTRTCNGNGCGNPIVCPADRNCEITCGNSACDSAILECADGHACDISCTSTSSCANSTINCPPDAPCTVTCSGTSACNGLEVVCPTGNHACEISCSGTSGCAGLDMTCGDGPCDVTCSNSNNVCGSADIVCGENACAGMCSGNSKATLACGASCDCTPC